MTQTEQTIMLSKEEAINCLVIASGYTTARVMVFGQSPNISNYGATLNPAISLAVMFNAPIQTTVTGGQAFKYIWLYPCFPFVGALCALVFYEFIFKKARELCNKGEDS